MKGPRLLVVAGVASGVGKTTITLGLLDAFRRRVVRPKNLVVGVGCNRGTAADEIVGAIRGVLREHGLSEKSVKTLATVDAKRDKAGLIDAAPRLGVPLVFCDKATLNTVAVAERPRETQ